MANRQTGKRKASMGDVAAAVGVSKTTISRYLHGEFGYMSDETKARIEAVIAELGYRPNRMAQGLKSTVSNMVGVTIANIGNPFSSQLIKGIQAECRARGVQLLVSDSDDESGIERANIESLLDAQVDGLIVNTVGGNDDYLRAFCAAAGHKPMVMLDRFVQPIVCDAVVTDNHGGAFEMLDHLVAQGYEYVVFVTRPADGVSTRTMRREAVEQYLLDNRLEGETLVYRAEPSELGERVAGIIATHPGEKICLFANNEETTRDILSAVPAATDGSLGLCAFADAEWARYSGRGITCLDQDPVRMGRTAAKALFARAYEGADAPYELAEIPATLNAFASTGA